MSQVTISKQIAIFKREQASYTAFSNFIPFTYSDNEDGFAERSLILTRKMVDDLGWPEEITVTIEPGDTLNKELSDD